MSSGKMMTLNITLYEWTTSGQNGGFPLSSTAPAGQSDIHLFGRAIWIYRLHIRLLRGFKPYGKSINNYPACSIRWNDIKGRPSNLKVGCLHLTIKISRKQAMGKKSSISWTNRNTTSKPNLAKCIAVNLASIVMVQINNLMQN